MSSSSNNISNNVPHSNPIPISGGRHLRTRSASVSSASSGSASSPSELPTPPSTSMGSQRISIPSPSQSPILSYFMNGQSPTKSATSNSFPFRRNFGPSPVFEEEEDKEIPVAAHARRTSVTVANRFSGQNPPMPDVLQDRGTGLLRRLSLSSSAFVKPPMDSTKGRGPPSPPPNSAVSPTVGHNPPPVNKPRRSATISDGARPRRAPSPMGERILKGHFDGFN